MTGVFGQTTTGPLGSSSVFGNTFNSSQNPFSPNSLGTTNSLSSATQGSVFGRSSSNAFGTSHSSTPIPTSFMFGQTAGSIGSSAVFGNNGNLNHSAFVPSSSSSGNTTFSTFQTHGSVLRDSSTGVFVPFGSSLFGNTFNSSQNPFSPNSSGTTNFATHGSVYGGNSSRAFGASQSSTPISTTSFMIGQTSGSIGSSAVFGNKSNSNHSSFVPSSGNTTFPTFQTHGSIFRDSSTGVFGAPSTSPASCPSFCVGKASSTHNNAFAFKPSESAPAFASQTEGSSFHSATRPNVLARSSFAASTSILSGSPGSSTQKAGTKIAPYTPTVTKEGDTKCKLISISAMPTYGSKSHEELRWEDYKHALGGGQHKYASHENGSIFDKQQKNFSFPSLKKPETYASPLLPNFQTFSTQSLASNASEQHPNESFGSWWNASLNPKPLTQFPTTPLQHNHSRVIYAAPQPAIAQVPSMITRFDQTSPAQPATPSPFSTVSRDLDQPSLPQQFFSRTEVANSVVAVIDPFGSKPAPSHSLSSHLNGSSLSQHGISSMPVSNKPASARVSSFLTVRHTSARPLTLHARKYRPKSDAPKVPFFDPIEETQSTPKALNFPIPRRNIRSLFCPSAELTHVAATKDEKSQLNNKPDEENPETDQFLDTRQLTPKLQRSDYYTKPEIHELAIKEITEPGSCSKVKDFVVGRHGFGWVKFKGETDVRGLNLDTLVEFNEREVIVYGEEEEKPPVGRGLNKPAEVTLLNIRCIVTMADKFTDKLRKVTQEQGAEFVSFDPINGEWRFRVKHF